MLDSNSMSNYLLERCNLDMPVHAHANNNATTFNIPQPPKDSIKMRNVTL
jgi:hypothetical protein